MNFIVWAGSNPDVLVVKSEFMQPERPPPHHLSRRVTPRNWPFSSDCLDGVPQTLFRVRRKSGNTDGKEQNENETERKKR